MTSEKPITDTELDRLVGAALSRAASDAAAPALAARIAEQAMLQSQDRYPVAAAQIGWGAEPETTARYPPFRPDPCAIGNGARRQCGGWLHARCRDIERAWCRIAGDRR